MENHKPYHRLPHLPTSSESKRANTVAQWVNVFAVKLHNLSSTPGSLLVEGENRFP